jgi:hypothetical protein
MTGELAAAVLQYGGITAFALLVMYFLYRLFRFTFAQIPPVFSGVIALAVVLIAGFLIYTAMTKPPVFIPTAPKVSSVSHKGELQNLVTHVQEDATSGFSINLLGSSADKASLSTLYTTSTAEDYAGLMRKMCNVNACIKCDFKDGVMNISKVGDIKPICKDKDNETVNCCA